MSITLRIILGPGYDDLAEQIEAKLQPVDILEVRLAAQIVRAHWRLDRCEKLDDPDHPEIDRIRYRAETSIRRNMAEIRQPQADRHLKAQLNLDLPGITRVKDVVNLKIQTQIAPPKDAVAEAETKITAVLEKEQELQSANLKIRTQTSGTPGRNAPCPCGSRLKHKRCCGRNAPPAT